MTNTELEGFKKSISTFYCALHKAAEGVYSVGNRHTIDWYQGRYEGAKVIAGELGLKIGEKEGSLTFERVKRK